MEKNTIKPWEPPQGDAPTDMLSAINRCCWAVSTLFNYGVINREVGEALASKISTNLMEPSVERFLSGDGSTPPELGKTINTIETKSEDS